jgi:hypothetical protein
MRVGAVSPAVSWFACPSPTLATGLVPISLTGRYPHRFALAGRVKALVLRTNTAGDWQGISVTCHDDFRQYEQSPCVLVHHSLLGLFISRGASAMGCIVA